MKRIFERWIKVISGQEFWKIVDKGGAPLVSIAFNKWMQRYIMDLAIEPVNKFMIRKWIESKRDLAMRANVQFT